MTSPWTSRARFNWRVSINLLLLYPLFVVLVSALYLFAPVLIPGVVGKVAAAGVSILFVSFLYLGLEKRSVRVRCPECGRIVLSSTPWECGVCKEANHNVKDYSFVSECGHCRHEPKAYQCHHCRKLIFLTEDEDNANYARRFDAASYVRPEKPKVMNPQERSEQKEAREHDIRMAELDEKLEESKRRKEMSRPKNPRDAIREDFDKAHAYAMAAEEIASEEKRLNAEKYKDDPYMLERSDRFVDDWLRKKI